MVTLLPWKQSKFCEVSGGYPNMFLTKTCLYITLALSMVITMGTLVIAIAQPDVSNILYACFSALNFARSAIQTGMLVVSFDLFRQAEESSSRAETRISRKELSLQLQILEEGKVSSMVTNPMNHHSGDNHEAGSRSVVGNKEGEADVEGDGEGGEDAVSARDVKGLVDLAMQHVVVLRNQLHSLGHRPATFMELSDIQSELQKFLERINAGQPFDEGKRKSLQRILSPRAVLTSDILAIRTIRLSTTMPGITPTIPCSTRSRPTKMERFRTAVCTGLFATNALLRPPRYL